MIRSERGITIQIQIQIQIHMADERPSRNGVGGRDILSELKKA